MQKFTLTGVVVSSNQVAMNGSNYVAEGVVDTWTPDQVERATWGSKMLVVLEEFMLTTLWLVKAGLLLLYYRMTYVQKERERERERERELVEAIP